MRQAFTGIANVLSAAGILTEDLLQNQVPQLVWDSAIAAGWYRPASETPEAIFPEQLGHYWVWRDHRIDWKGLFYSETREWRAWLLENPAPLQSGPTPSSGANSKSDLTEQRAIAERAARRRAVTNPILERKGWTSSRLASEAGVGKNSIYQYLDGTRAKITDANRKAIAQVLELV